MPHGTKAEEGRWEEGSGRQWLQLGFAINCPAYLFPCKVILPTPETPTAHHVHDETQVCDWQKGYSKNQQSPIQSLSSLELGLEGNTKAAHKTSGHSMSSLYPVLSQCQLSVIGSQYTKVFSLIDINPVPLMANMCCKMRQFHSKWETKLVVKLQNRLDVLSFK